MQSENGLKNAREMELDFAMRALKATLYAPLRAPQELVPLGIGLPAKD